MNESFREHRPLLYDESDEEHESIGIKKYKIANIRGSARYKIQGAAAIIRRWPDHWSAVVYWWILLGMIVITVLIIFNSIMTFAFMPSPYYVDEETSIFEASKQIIPRGPPNNVYMHVFVGHNQEYDLNKYIPYLNKITDDFKELKFHFVVVYNDVTPPPLLHGNDIRSRRSNPNARNKRNVIPYLKNFEVQQVILSKHLDSSPFDIHWRILSPVLFPFLVRILSVWERGGVAFNPALLKLPNKEYNEKIANVLEIHTSNIRNKNRKSNYNQSKKIINNIQDVIASIGEDNRFFETETLEEAENKVDSLKVDSKTKAKRDVNNELESSYSESKDQLLDSNSVSNNKELVSTKLSDLDLNNKLYNNQQSTQSETVPTKSKQAVISAERKNEQEVLRLDINGEIVQTNIQCHAFIGQIFTSILNYSQNNLTDFILNELSIFCKGYLSYCNGIEIVSL